MSALQKWNGGVIIISHDERFITTVAKEVSSSLPNSYCDADLGDSCGFAEMAPSLSSVGTCRVTRLVTVIIVFRWTRSTELNFSELDCEQHQSQTVVQSQLYLRSLDYQSFLNCIRATGEETRLVGT